MTDAIQVAAPFLVGAILLLFGALIAEVAAGAVIAEKYKPAWERIPEDRRPLDLMPETIQNMLDWTVDATQLLGVIVAPAVGLIFTLGEFNAAVTLVYSGALLLAFAATVLFLTRVKAVNYGKARLGLRFGQRVVGIRKWKWLTPVTTIGVVTNLVAAALAAGLTFI